MDSFSTRRNRKQHSAFASARRTLLQVIIVTLCFAPFQGSRVLIQSPLCVASAFSTRSTSNSPLAIANPENDPFKFDIRSCSPPRFDTFGDLLVGKWAIQNSIIVCGDDDTSASNGFVAEVEEVMRSCGGAVQGIREPATNIGNNHDTETSSTYLNRANDGFVFFDDGGYTMGPLSIGQGKSEDFLSCLVLPEKDPDGRTQRFVFGFGDSNEEIYKGTGPLPHTVTLRTKQRFGDTALASSSSEDDKIEITSNCVIEEITRIIRCRMPSEGQPWMLQRAKWESLVPVVAKEKDDGSASSSTDSRNPLVWATAESLREFYTRLGITASNMGDSSDDGIVVQTAFACTKSNTLQILARHYQRSSSDSTNDSATLKTILRVEANIRFNC